MYDVRCEKTYDVRRTTYDVKKMCDVQCEKPGISKVFKSNTPYLVYLFTSHIKRRTSHIKLTLIIWVSFTSYIKHRTSHIKINISHLTLN
jgi:hypothetical protein